VIPSVILLVRVFVKASSANSFGCLQNCLNFQTSVVHQGLPCRSSHQFIGNVAIGKPERHVRKASHRGSKQ